MTHPSTLTLHRMRYGELSALRVRELEAHLEGCERCRSQLRSQLNSRAAFELAPVPAAIRGARRRPSAAWRWAGFLLPAAGLAAALMLLPVDGAGVQALLDGSLPAEQTRTKGGPGALEVWLDRGGAPAKLAEGAPVHAGDRVQLRYRASRGWVSFAGIDGAGRVEVYRSVRVTGSGWHAAPFSLTLDDTPGAQRFLAIFTEARPDRDQVADALESGNTPADMKIEQVTLVKAR